LLLLLVCIDLERNFHASLTGPSPKTKAKSGGKSEYGQIEKILKKTRWRWSKQINWTKRKQTADVAIAIAAAIKVKLKSLLRN